MMDAARIGIDVGEKLPLEQAIAWAAREGVRIIDVQLDYGDNAVTRIDAARAGPIAVESVAPSNRRPFVMTDSLRST